MSKINYSFGERFLHRLALEKPWIGQISLDLELLAFGKGDLGSGDQPVFISGLARAGTTILMRTFYDTGIFRSITYRDMPFVLMPGIWKRLSRIFHQQEALKERAHGDGVFVNFDSPEAFEEIFWRTFCADDYIFENHLRPHHINQEVISLFQAFVSQVVLSADDPKQRRYLSKNNNNILRLGTIRRAFPEGLILIPFRDPVQQSISLLQQHIKFCNINAKDHFASDYMRWLGHHEFGATHKPFWFDNDFSIFDPEYGSHNVHYWLAIWCSAYSYILKLAPSGSLFVNFEELCRIPEVILKNLFNKAGLSSKAWTIAEKIKAPEFKTADNINEELRSQANSVHRKLLAKAVQRF